MRKYKVLLFFLWETFLFSEGGGGGGVMKHLKNIYPIISTWIYLTHHITFYILNKKKREKKRKKIVIMYIIIIWFT